MKSWENFKAAQTLRRAAEAEAEARAANRAPQTEGTWRRLQHELEVHQIELEMQNDELRAARAQLEASVDRYTNLYDFAPVGYFSLTAEGAIKLVNLTGAKFIGVERAQLLDQRFEAFVVASDRPAFNQFLRQIFTHDGAQDCEIGLLKKGGNLHLVSLVASIPAGDGECQFVLQDITERKRAEERMQLQSSALMAAANGIMITGPDGTIEWVNPAFTKLTGYAAEEAIGQKPRLLKSGRHPPAFYANLWGTISAGKVWYGELINLRKDGSLYTEETTITPVRGADGRITHFVAIKQDVTERRQLDSRLQQAQKMEAIGRLAGGIAHDFNNILAAMFGFTYLLEEETAANPAAQEEIKEILKAANRAKDLVQQILTFSQQREQKREIIWLDTVVKEAAKLLRASLPAQIKIDLKLMAEAPPVLADPTQIYQVTMNLATNAQHAMGSLPGTLTIHLGTFRPDGDFLQSHPDFQPIQYAQLTVADTGCGMDEKTQARIYEPFFTTKPVGQGTGLGLAVVHGIMQSQGGLITVDSRVGQGTTFKLYFPAQRAATVTAETAKEKVPRGQKQKILLVDDEVGVTLAFKRLLEELNYQVTCSNQALAAVELLRQSPAGIDLVITDLTMPEMNGLELARQIHALRPDLPIILTSGFASEFTEDDLRQAGICELLQKPVSRAALAEAAFRALVAAKS